MSTETLVIEDYQLMVLLQAYHELVEEHPYEDVPTQHNRHVFLSKLETFYRETIGCKRFLLVALPPEKRES